MKSSIRFGLLLAGVLALAGCFASPAFSAESEVMETVQTASSTLKETANNLLVSIISGATQAVDFLKGEIPLVIKELLLFNAVMLWAAVILGLGLVIFAIIWLIRGLKKAQEINKGLRGLDTKDGPYIIAILPALGASVTGLVFFFCNIAGALKLTLAPRIWLIEYAADLVR